MEKKTLITLLLLILALPNVNAQEYYVYSVIGDVKEVKGKIASELTVRQTLTPQSVISVGKSSNLVIIDPVNSKQHTISDHGTTTLARFLNKSASTTKELTKMYLSYIMKQIRGKGVLTSQRAINEVGGAIERDVEDSLFVDFELPDSVLEKE